MSHGMKHGSETFFIEGEGLLTTQVGGRTGDEGDPLSQSDNPKAGRPRPLPAATPPPFRFSRVGPKGHPLNATITRKLARAMVVGGGGAGRIPAGYTYLGQFVDHDLTMDRTDVALGEDVSPAELLQGRSPRLDLDSLYGNGPGNPQSAKFYESDGMHLKTGTTIPAEGVKAKPRHDLPRVGKGGLAASQKALIPDPRNDENLIVAQTHLAMINFHNKVVDKTSSTLPAVQRFVLARKRVTLHYQWLLRHDYLPRICAPTVVDSVFKNGRKLVEPDAKPTDVPTMPIEFSVAAFRLGHSMIRADYNWNSKFPGTAGTLDWMFFFSALGWRPRWREAADQQLDRRLAPDVRLPGSRQAGTRGTRQRRQHGDADRHPPHRPAVLPAAEHVRGRRERPEPAAQPRLPQPHAGQHGQAGERAADGDEDEGPRHPGDPADEGADPQRQRRREARPPDDGREELAGHADAALVLHPARGRDEQRPAQGRRRAPRGRDLPPGDGGQPLLDRAHTRPSSRPSALGRAPSR